MTYLRYKGFKEDIEYAAPEYPVLHFMKFDNEYTSSAPAC